MTTGPHDFDEHLYPERIPYVTGPDGRRRLLEPNEREVGLAAQVLNRAATRRGLNLVDPVDDLAYAIAAAREGATLPGQRRRLRASLVVDGRLWREQGDELRADVYARLRREWVGLLEAAHSRPIGWPQPVAVGLRHGERVIDLDRYEDEELERRGVPDAAYLVLVRLGGWAVPA